MSVLVAFLLVQIIYSCNQGCLYNNCKNWIVYSILYAVYNVALIQKFIVVYYAHINILRIKICVGTKLYTDILVRAPK